MVKLAVNEIFGPTWQGEGPSLGRQATFLRLAMCNLKCSWCDTKYTWDWKGEFGPPQSRDLNIDLHTPEDLAQELNEHHKTPLLVITGGEPLLQQKAIGELIPLLSVHLARIELETNGTIEPIGKLDRYSQVSGWIHYNVSPKLTNSGNSLKKRTNGAALNWFVAQGAIFKFVVTNRADLLEVADICGDFGIRPSRVWISPEGIDSFTLGARASGLAEEVLQRGWNMTTRLHILLWGNKRGV